MQRKPFIVFIILLCTQLAFPQQHQLIQQDDKSKINLAPFTENSGYIVSSSKYVNDERETTQIFPTRGVGVDWGLALSGGGVRSAAFSIGVLKVLYDKKILDEVDVISSVSGGGYASYWLFTQYYKSKGKGTFKFGETAFNDNKYIENICDLQNFDKSNTLPNKYLLKLILNFEKDGAFNTYKDALVKSFGNKVSPDLPLDAFSDEMKNNDVPYFIINTTAQLSYKELDLSKSDKKREIKKLHSVFEITPKFMGNPKIGFTDWTEYDRKPTLRKPTLSESMAMSGAPKWKIERALDKPKQIVLKNEKLRLSDGGHSENLAALALIRRGIKNVIIVDAEQDANYKFLAYKDLQKMLNELDIELKVPDIDNLKTRCFLYKPNKGESKKVCSPSSVMIGKATKRKGNPIDTNIYYIKMSQPESIYLDRFSKTNTDISDTDTNEACPESEKHPIYDGAYRKGYELWTKRCKERCDVDICPDKDVRTCNCANIKPNLANEYKNNKNIDLENLYTYVVKNYSDFINYPSKNNSKFPTRAKIKFMNIVGKIDPFFAYKFPHTTTADQSFYSDQLEAFVGLGYLQALELELKLKE